MSRSSDSIGCFGNPGVEGGVMNWSKRVPAGEAWNQGFVEVIAKKRRADVQTDPAG